MKKNKKIILGIINFFKVEKNNLLKKNIYFLNKKKKNYSDTNSLDPLLKTLLSSLIIVSIFFTLPVLIKFTKERMFAFKDFENNSKNNFKKILEGKSNTEDSELNKNFVFDDILEFDNMPTDSVRLSASTIEQLFKDTDYNLNKVRKEKLVKPVSLTLLPSEIKMIENTKKRKELFIQIILPLIIKENNYIRLDRKKLFSILNKSKNTRAENNWLGSKFKQYGVINKDLSTLKIRMDEVPVSMAIAQAAKETGWGTSRFAQE